MKKYFVTLNDRSRFPKPPMAGFLWLPELSTYAWKGQAVTEIEDLATFVTEAAAALHALSNSVFTLSVTPVQYVPESPVIEPSPESPSEEIQTRSLFIEPENDVLKPDNAAEFETAPATELIPPTTSAPDEVSNDTEPQKRTVRKLRPRAETPIA